MSLRGGRLSRSRSRSRSRSPVSARGRRREDDRPWLKRSRSRSRSPRNNRGRRSRSPFKRPVMRKEPKFLNSRVFVANLASDETSEAELQELFSEYGSVIDTLVHHNRYGFVQFSTEEEGRRAVEAMNGATFHGKKIKCNMAAEGKRSGGGKEGGGGGGGPPPPNDNRYGSPGRDQFGPPYDSPYMRGRELPPPGADLPPPPPRDPFFDDPYRRPPLDPYFDRYRDDPYRHDPYRMGRYPDPYGAAPKKPVAVDCEIIIMNSELRPYADMVERRLKNINVLTNVMVLPESCSTQTQVEECARRNCLFVVIINPQNEIHRSLTLNILHGVAQEHRNMPLDDALSLVARSFEKFLASEKERLSQGAAAKPASDTAEPFTPPSKDIIYLLNLLADSRQLTLEEIEKVMAYLAERRDKLKQRADLPSASLSSAAALTQYPQQQLQQQLLQQQLHLQQQQEQQQQQKQHKELENKILSMMNGSPSALASTRVTMPASIITSRQPSTSSVLGVAALNPPSTSGVKAPASSSATLINFDNPTVQRALDNLIQSGPNLLKNFSSPTSYPSSSSRPPHY